MKELGIAVQMYYGDYDATLPSSGVYFAPGTAWTEANCESFNLITSLPTLGANQFPTWAYLLYPNMKNKDIIYCPSDPSDKLPGANKYLSYYWKAAIDKGWYAQLGRKEGDFEFPADQIVFFEHNGWHWGDAARGLINGVSINCTIP